MAPRYRVVSFAAVLALATSLSKAQPSLVDVFLDPSRGEIGGRRAIGVLAARGGPNGLEEVYSPQGFTAHLSLLEDPGVEHTYPAGQWFSPPPGRYRVWVASEWLISSDSTLIGYAASRFEGRGFRVVLQVEEGGKVRLPDMPTAWDANLELRLLHAGGYVSERGAVGFELVRRCRVGDVGDGALMPAGRTVAVLWDPSKEAYVALSRPFDVEAGQVVFPLLGVPEAGRAHLVVQIRRDRNLAHSDERGLDARVDTASGAIPADTVVEAADIAYAFWFDIPAGKGRLVVEPRGSARAEMGLDLRGGEIHRVILKQAAPIDFQRSG